MKKLPRHKQPVMLISKRDNGDGRVFGIGLFILFAFFGFVLGGMLVFASKELPQPTCSPSAELTQILNLLSQTNEAK